VPLLIFLRQYGLREYAITLAIAALVGLALAVLINSAAGGGAGSPTILKTKQELADASSRVLTTRVYKPVRQTRPAPAHHRVHQARHRHVHRARPAPAPAPVVHVVPVSAPASSPRPQPAVSKPAPAPAPAPVVHRPAPKPAPRPAPKPSGGGSVQFDDSG
jgi:hypothetical protein